MKRWSYDQSFWMVAVLLISSACSNSMAAPTPTQMPTYTPVPTETPMPTETPTPTATPLWNIGDTWARPADGMVMVQVPAGNFVMGSPDGDLDEQPVHTVYLDAYWIDQTEVSVAMYALFTPDASMTGPGDLPAVEISWEEAAAYCTWAGGRLPSEAEWEKAARGTDGRTYPWGNQSPAGNLLNFADRSSHLSWADIIVDDGYEKMAPVGSYPEGGSLYGALDMAGNASEWVNDWYESTYYSSSDGNNPAGPSSGDYRILRGGSWYSNTSGIRVADRSWYIPEGVSRYAGFRCASPSPGLYGAP